jgi:hypothetical protein
MAGAAGQPLLEVALGRGGATARVRRGSARRAPPGRLELWPCSLHSDHKGEMMRKPIGKVITCCCLMFAGSALSLPRTAYAADVIQAVLVACPSDGTLIGGVNSCGKIWKIQSGNARLTSDGALKIEVKGLVLNDTSLPPDVNGTADGVTEVVATLVCTGGGAVRVAAESSRVPLSKSGDANVNTTLTLPKNCAAPALLIREIWEGKIGGWLAATGF